MLQPKRVLHVGITWRATLPKTEEAEKLFQGEWVRYGNNMWLVYTNETPKALGDRIHAAFSPQDSVFVISVNANDYSGWQPQVVWDWLKKPR